MDEDGFLKSGKLKRAFDVFDVTKTGAITEDNLKVALAAFLTGDEELDDALIAKIFNEVEVSGLVEVEELLIPLISLTRPLRCLLLERRRHHF